MGADEGTDVRELNSRINKGGQWDSASMVARSKNSRATVATAGRNAGSVAPVGHN